MKFSDLGADLAQEAVPVNMAEIPDQIKEFAPLPQPGTGFRFKMPQIKMSDDNWGKAGQQENRISYSFRKGKELLIVDAPREDYVGQKVGWMVTNTESQWGGKANEGKSAVSGMDFLLRDGFGITLPKNSSNAAYAQALTKASDRVFGGRVRWSGSCNKNKDIYRVTTDAEGNVTFSGEVKGIKGCGTRYGLQYRKAKKPGDPDTLVIPRYPEGTGEGWDGLYMDRFECLKCGGKTGSRISVFLDLGEFEKVEAEGAEGQEEQVEGTEEVQEEAPAEEVQEEVAEPAPAPVQAPKAAAPAGKAPGQKAPAPAPPSKPAGKPPSKPAGRR